MSKKHTTTARRQKSAFEKETERALVEPIHRLLALPMSKRTHFLRVRRPRGRLTFVRRVEWPR
jgi:hypothetical protein